MSTLTATAEAPALLPTEIPIFPLPGVILLPRAKLPLNIFEPRYLAMIDDVLAQGRLIGMIQPNAPEGQDDGTPPIYKVGCAGRITSFNETEDGRFLIGLTGVCRFSVINELPADKPYRRARVDWQSFIDDIHETEDNDFDRKRLMSILQNYFKMQGIAADWNAVQNTPNDLLISSLTMICPLATNEKQALLEAPNLQARADMLVALLEMATLPQGAEAEAGIKH
ncbi:MAG TPA: LON peptidase substrate-binding domain-containing protein [Alphaproteobacteria bacterium]|nr:LON peptidase substrate-binding domain-containing protein [Alphaproteobacteria bacterium]